MFRIAIAALIFSAAAPISAVASMTSYHFLGPVPMMHDLPVGESPGWASSNWLNMEIGYSSVWTKNAAFTDNRTGDIYRFFADYEQATAFAEIGHAFGETVAIAVEVPYANHNGGFTDDFVDQFHTWIGSDRFARDVSPKYGNHLVIQKNGVDQLASEHAEGAGNIKAKMKLWLLPWHSQTPGACDCGFAISGQAKFPLQSRENGLSSGHNDYSGLAHLGIPIGSASGIWATAAVTKLGRNDTFAGWPVRTWQQMYELNMNLGVGDHFGLIMTGRVESPLFDRSYLDFNYTETEPQAQINEIVSSAWNSLVEWRGSQGIGVRWHWGGGNEIGFMFIEDWGIGDQNQSGDGLYVNDAPDFQIMTQWHFVF